MRVATSEQEDGLLVLHQGVLVGVLVRLSALHDDDEGKWFLEAGFGKLEDAAHCIFADLDAALDVIGYHLGGQRMP